MKCCASVFQMLQLGDKLVLKAAGMSQRLRRAPCQVRYWASRVCVGRLCLGLGLAHVTLKGDWCAYIMLERERGRHRTIVTTLFRNASLFSLLSQSQPNRPQRDMKGTSCRDALSYPIGESIVVFTGLEVLAGNANGKESGSNSSKESGNGNGLRMIKH